jgi:hypothetical protein
VIARATALLVLVAGCERADRAASPMEYHWPELLTYYLEYVAETQGEQGPLLRYAEAKVINIAERGERFWVFADSVLRTTHQPGEAVRAQPPAREDTLDFHVDLGRRGELREVVPGCDPVLADCAAAFPSAIQIELRRLIPRLALWPVPPGGSWVDTLTYSDASRPGGARGTVVTRYRSHRDTVVGDESYWVIAWQSRRTAYRSAADGALSVSMPIEETGITIVDKRRLVPVYTAWAGAVAAPPELRAAGATGTGFRGRAVARGSWFDRRLAEDRPPR